MALKTTLSLRAAAAFASQHGLSSDFSRIKELTSGIRSSVQRGYVVQLFEQQNVLQSFIERHWPFGSTPKGKSKQRSYLRLMERHASGELGKRATVIRKRKPKKGTTAVPFSAATPAACETIFEALTYLNKAVALLRDSGAIRSQRLIGDLGEWIASQALGQPLCANLVNAGWDIGTADHPLQVKTHSRAHTNRNRRTTLRGAGTPFNELVIVVLTPEFLLRSIYRVPADVLQSDYPVNGKGNRVIEWRRLSIHELKTVPRVLAPLIAKSSALVAEDTE